MWKQEKLWSTVSEKIFRSVQFCKNNSTNRAHPCPSSSILAATTNTTWSTPWAPFPVPPSPLTLLLPLTVTDNVITIRSQTQPLLGPAPPSHFNGSQVIWWWLHRLLYWETTTRSTTTTSELLLGTNALTESYQSCLLPCYWGLMHSPRAIKVVYCPATED